MAQRRIFQDLRYKLRDRVEAHERFKELVADDISIILKREIKDVSKALDKLLPILEKEMDKNDRTDRQSQNVCFVLMDMYKHLPDMQYVDFSVTKTERSIDEFIVTQPGIDTWKFLRLCYLQEKDFENLLAMDHPQFIYAPIAGNTNAPALIEGNTRVLYSQRTGKKIMPVTIIGIHGNKEFRDEIALSISSSVDHVRQNYGSKGVNSLRVAFYRGIIQKMKGYKIELK